MKLEDRLNKLVSLAVLLPAIWLILFMFFQSFVWFFHSWTNLFNFLSWAKSITETPSFHTQALGWLQAVATIVILVKAYRILISYVKTHHLSIKYLLEINFTATSLELLFNEASYDLEMKIVFLVLWLSSLLIYVLFPKQILDLEKEH